jgi:hypothetical protein
MPLILLLLGLAMLITIISVLWYFIQVALAVWFALLATIVVTAAGAALPLVVAGRRHCASRSSSRAPAFDGARLRIVHAIRSVENRAGTPSRGWRALTGLCAIVGGGSTGVWLADLALNSGRLGSQYIYQGAFGRYPVDPYASFGWAIILVGVACCAACAWGLGIGRLYSAAGDPRHHTKVREVPVRDGQVVTRLLQRLEDATAEFNLPAIASRARERLGLAALAALRQRPAAHEYTIEELVGRELEALREQTDALEHAVDARRGMLLRLTDVGERGAWVEMPSELLIAFGASREAAQEEAAQLAEWLRTPCWVADLVEAERYEELRSSLADLAVGADELVAGPPLLRRASAAFAELRCAPTVDWPAIHAAWRRRVKGCFPDHHDRSIPGDRQRREQETTRVNVAHDFLEEHLNGREQEAA